jgi:hypothetical protein
MFQEVFAICEDRKSPKKPTIAQFSLDYVTSFTSIDEEGRLTVDTYPTTSQGK